LLTAQKNRDTMIACVATGKKGIEDLLSKQWLLTNSRGGYASSTVAGCNSSRYHGLLIGALNPPANRIMALSQCMEMLIAETDIFNLSTSEFGEKISPEGFKYIRQFRQDIGVHFDYELDDVELTKSIYLLQDIDTVGLVYDFTTVQRPAEFILRPFVGLRDLHSLQKSYAPLCSAELSDGLFVSHNIPGSCELFLKCPLGTFEKDQQWWFNFVYRDDAERGYDFTEDLWTPGFFKCRIDSPTRIVFWANLSSRCNVEQLENIDIDQVCAELQRHQGLVIAPTKTSDNKLVKLCLAADQFVIKRNAENNDRTTILAGYPWFADWGRDTFLSLQGLLLSTGRFGETKSVLTTFAQAADEGMIPNRFDDRSDTAYFNSIDASLWFINAAFQYLDATGDSRAFTSQLLPTIRWIMEAYHNGTRFGIHADEDGLITAGDQDTQLTWMDAKYDGIAFTPRYGKAVEINALWYNALCQLSRFYAETDPEAANHYKSMAEKAGDSFCKLFWNKSAGYLNDCILPDGTPDATLRPNQIFAVSLEFSPLSDQQKKSVVEAVQKELLTPYGLRTLSQSDSNYKGIYTGDQQQRDQAYHQGTVWSYLIGPFVESYLKVNGFSRKSKRKAAEFIEPLMRHLDEDACMGQVSEIFDGDEPHKPKGCFAQAWSIAELIRVYKMINS
jgi:predicted glycogen debranching enzyme